MVDRFTITTIVENGYPHYKVYDNLTDKHDITMVEDYANTLEFEGKVGTVVVTSKI